MPLSIEPSSIQVTATEPILLLRKMLKGKASLRLPTVERRWVCWRKNKT